MIIDTSNRRTRLKTQLFINETFNQTIVTSSLAEKCFDDYKVAFAFVKKVYTLNQSLKCVGNTYIDLSTGFVESSTTKNLLSIGEGLFANKLLLKGTVIDYFIGVLRSTEDYGIRVSHGYGGYAIQLNKFCVLDCFGSSLCKCSMANSPLGVSVDTSGSVVTANASLHVNVNRCGSVKLVAACDIKFGSEIFYDYESSFILPEFN